MQPIPIAVVAALDDEIRVVLSKMEVDSRAHVKPSLFTKGSLCGKGLVMARSGIGIAAMESACSYLFSHFSPAFCLHVGYCGGAEPKDAPGDLLIAETVVDARSGERIEVAPGLTERAEAVARERELRARRGTLVTVEKVVENPHEKAFAGTQHSAAGIDMESAALAIACRERGIPWLVVRAVLDPLDVALPDMGDSVTEEGGTDGVALAEHLVRNPKDIFSLPRLQYFAGQARNSITEFVEGWIEKS